MPSLLVREGSNKESTYTSDIHVPLNFLYDILAINYYDKEKKIFHL